MKKDKVKSEGMDMNRKLILILIFSSIFMLLAACGDNDKKEEEEAEGTTETEEREPLEFSDEELVDEESPVVKVNGEEINGNNYNQIYRQIKTMMYQFGQDVSETDAIKEQVISMLVDQEILNQDAKEKDITVTAEEADEELEKVKEQAGDQFTTILEQYDMTEEEFKNQLVNELTTSKYVSQEISDEITDAEINEFYDQMKEENEEIPELDEVKEEITSMLQGEKLQKRIEELKEKAEIEELI